MSTQIDNAAKTLSRFEDVGSRLTGGNSDGFLTLAEANAVLESTQPGQVDQRLANVSEQDRNALRDTASTLVSANPSAGGGGAQWTQAGQSLVSQEGTGRKDGFSTNVVPGGALVNSATAEQSMVSIGPFGMIGPDFGAETVAANTLKISRNAIFPLDRSVASKAVIRDQINVPVSLPEISADAPYKVGKADKPEAPAGPAPLPGLPDNPLLQMKPGESQSLQGPNGQNWTITASSGNMPPSQQGATLLGTVKSENTYTVSIDGAPPGTNSSAQVNVDRTDGSVKIESQAFWKPGDAQLFGGSPSAGDKLPSTSEFSQQIADYFTKANGGEGESGAVSGQPNVVLWTPGKAPEGHSYRHQP